MQILLMLLTLFVYFASPSYSQEGDRKDLTIEEKQGLLNKLLAPGPLMIGHQDLEHKDCLKCHDAGSGVPKDKCLDCHTEIKSSIAKGNTFHALHKKDCYECHADHKGRSNDTTIVDHKKFNHDLTGFKLSGAHQKTKCEDCHTQKRVGKPIRADGIRFLNTSRTCVSCHKSDDVHFFKGKWADKDCGSCHNDISWKSNTKFDHLRDAGYELKGRHSKLSCEKCHVPNGEKSARYQWPIKTQQCLSCHNDIHGQNLSPRFQGGTCDQCHVQEKWKIDDFDHSVTGYPLVGAHSKVPCKDCHTQTTNSTRPKDFKYRGLKKDCISCHDDYHSFDQHKSNRFGNVLDCKKCHNETSFKQNIDFNHNFDTRWEISGKHRKNKCFDCHIANTKIQVKAADKKSRPKSRTYYWPHLTSKTCENCHKNPHLKTFSPQLLKKKCTECHVTEGWNIYRKDKGSFNHDTTRFPLTGKHEKASCDSCHLINKKQVYKFPNAEKKFCVACHQNVHTKQFRPNFQNKACVECHTTNSFRSLKPFDHNKTRLPLVGQHKKIEKSCGKCHIKTSKMLPTKPPRNANKFVFGNAGKGFCVECHKSPHSGQFSAKFLNASCTQCHTNDNFTKRKPFNHNVTRFPLRFKHQSVKCEECHKPTKIILGQKPTRYKSRFVWKDLPVKDCQLCHEDVHKGEMGARCSDCHIEKGFDHTRNFHRNFTLSGVHYTLQCSECHIDNRRLGGLSEQCQICHIKDDVHNMTLPNCSDCHRQNFWEITSFKHSNSAFPLRGAHRTLTCASCHADGIYQGKPSNCIDCHRGDAAAVVFPNHSGPEFQQCSDCHNQFIFQNPRN